MVALTLAVALTPWHVIICNQSDLQNETEAMSTFRVLTVITSG